LRGVFVAIEGPDGSGKTTVANRLAAALRAAGADVVFTREPGGTALGERIRDLLLNSDGDAMAAETEALLFAAARAQHVREVIRPALARGAVVVSDRFIDSSLAYQAGGRGLPLEAVLAAQTLATGGLEPDLKILLDVPAEVALRRRLADASQANRLDREGIEFYQRVHRAYHSLVVADSDRWRVVDATRAPEQVWQDVWQAVTNFGLLAPERMASADGAKGQT
jgi:dTMP kinase